MLGPGEWESSPTVNSPWENDEASLSSAAIFARMDVMRSCIPRNSFKYSDRKICEHGQNSDTNPRKRQI